MTSRSVFDVRSGILDSDLDLDLDLDTDSTHHRLTDNNPFSMLRLSWFQWFMRELVKLVKPGQTGQCCLEHVNAASNMSMLPRTREQEPRYMTDMTDSGHDGHDGQWP